MRIYGKVAFRLGNDLRVSGGNARNQVCSNLHLNPSQLQGFFAPTFTNRKPFATWKFNDRRDNNRLPRDRHRSRRGFDYELDNGRCKFKEKEDVSYKIWRAQKNDDYPHGEKYEETGGEINDGVRKGFSRSIYDSESFEKEAYERYQREEDIEP
ncbi:3607_t:CDS:1, partial [Acaulospora colombiana]